MESSRGGPLSTLIMTLPLIVVPTVAMLKPPGNPVGVVTDMLSASAESDFASDSPGGGSSDQFSDFEEAPMFAAGDNAFGEEIRTNTDSEPMIDLLNDLLNEPMQGFSPDFPSEHASAADEFLFDDDGGSPFSSSVAPNQNQAAEVNRLLYAVQQTGASEVMWFQPGGSSQGFIAFFHLTSPNQTLRFEAVASSKSAAIKDVLLQIQQRQRR